MVESKISNISFCKKEEFQKREKVDCVLNVKSDTVKKMINVKACPFIGKTYENNGRISYKGKVVFYACYLTEEGIKKSENTVELNGEFAELENVLIKDVFVSACLEKEEYSLSGDFLSLSGYVTVTAKVLKENTVSVLGESEDIISKTEEETYYKNFGLKTGVYPVYEDFETDYEITEVLAQSAQVITCAVQCGVGNVIVDGEVHFSVLLLQNSENSDIIKEQKTIPFRMEIDYEEAMPTNDADVSLTINSLKTDISVDGETKKSKIELNIGVEYSCEVFSAQTETVIKDVFSVTENLETEKESVEVLSPVKLCSNKEKAKERVSVEALPLGARLMCVENPQVEIVDYSLEGNSVNIQGVLTLTAFIKDAESQISSFKIETPVSIKTACSLDGEKVNVKVFADVIGAKILSLSEIELEIEYAVLVKSQTKSMFDCVKSVESKGEKTVEDSAISVYIPLEGEDLWSLSKRLNVVPETLSIINKDLQFPTSGKERIVVYRQK